MKKPIKDYFFKTKDLDKMRFTALMSVSFLSVENTMRHLINIAITFTHILGNTY